MPNDRAAPKKPNRPNPQEEPSPLRQAPDTCIVRVRALHTLELPCQKAPRVEAQRREEAAGLGVGEYHPDLAKEAACRPSRRICPERVNSLPRVSTPRDPHDHRRDLS